MKKIMLMTSMLLLFVACETGVKNKGAKSEPVLSGIVDKRDNPYEQYSSIIQKSSGSSHEQNFQKIFSKSAQPGFYLQMAVFAKHRPSKRFLQPLNSSPFSYIVLNKYNKDYVLIGPYTSYNSARAKMPSVKARLGKKTFVVQVLRP